MRYEGERPTPFKLLVDFDGSLIVWLVAISAVASFPPAIILVVGGFWYRYNWLTARYEKERLLIEQRNRERKESLASDLANCQRLAAAGNREAQYRYGLALAEGDEFIDVGMHIDEQEGYEWIGKAAEQGYPDAFRKLGYAHLRGNGLHPKDTERAAEYFMRAHKAGAHGMLEEIQKIQDQVSAERSDEAARLRMELNESSWKETKRILSTCESPPERVLLEALIQVGKLRPDGRSLSGQVSVEPQVPVKNYRLDFLIDGWLAVEVDGKAHHDNPRSFENDRRRDQILLQESITTMRFSASQILKDAHSAARDIIKVANQRR